MRIRDVGFLPEGEIQARAGADAPYVMGHDGKRYPMKKIVAAAELASSLRPGVEQQLVRLMSDHVSLAALNAFAAMGQRAKPAVAALRTMIVVDKRAPKRASGYGVTALKKLLADLSA